MQILIKPKQYEVIYTKVFQKELSSIVNYILYVLRNRTGASRIFKNVIGAINSRSKSFPDAYEVIKFKGSVKKYYRIYINNYVVYYSLKENLMIIEHIFYSKQNALEIIKQK